MSTLVFHAWFAIYAYEVDEVSTSKRKPVIGAWGGYVS